MASTRASTSKDFDHVSNKVLDLQEDCNVAIIALKDVQEEWHELGTQLNVLPGTLSRILHIFAPNGDHFKHLSELISAWIRRERPTDHPSWRQLCIALYAMKKWDLANKIAQEHGDGRAVTISTGSTTDGSTKVAAQDQYGGITDLRKLKNILNRELDSEYADLESLLEANIAPFASQLYQNDIITTGAQSKPTFNAIMKEVKAMVCKSAEAIIERFKKFLEIVSGFGGPLKNLAEHIAECMSKAVLKEFKDVNLYKQ